MTLLIALLFSLSAEAATLCPSVNGAKPEPAVMSLPDQAGGTALVCGYLEKNKSQSNRKFIMEMKVVHAAKGKEPDTILDTSEYLSYFAEKKPGSILIDRSFFFNQTFVPFLRSELRCKKGKCTLSAEKCLKPKLEKPALTLAEMTAHMKAGTLPQDTYVARVRDLAFTGDKEAFAFFQMRDPSLKLDGAGAEGFELNSIELNLLKKRGCI